MFQVHKEIRVAVFPKEVDFSAATTLNSSVPEFPYADGLNDTFAYDQDGRQTQSISARYGVQVDKAYGLDGQMTSETTTLNGVAKTVGYEFDTAGRQTRVIYPDGRTV